MFRSSNLIYGCVLAIVGVGLAGCGTPRHYAPVESRSEVQQTWTVSHQYTVATVDAADKPLPGVTVEVNLSPNRGGATTVTCVSDEFGRCEPMTIEVSRDPKYQNIASYSSTAEAKGTKPGYYEIKGVGYIHDMEKKSNSRDIKLKLIQPLDYLDGNLANSAADKELRKRVLSFLEVIKLQSLLTDSEVMLKGVGTSEFKGKKYLRLRVNSTTVYNSLKLDKYAIGKRLYDDTVRKVLNPLNDHIAAPKAYYGYDIVVYGHTKNLTQEYATPAKIEYRFLLPEPAVRRYKEKDISGQALLDAGVLLMDDERVEFKLQ